MTACLMVGLAALHLSSPQFTLKWTHSVEKVEWVESWQVQTDGLHLLGAKVKGSGAGMEPDDSAVLRDGWWVWSADRLLPELDLAASGATGAGWQICDGATCTEIGAAPGAAIRLAPCAP
jgi:hypothetical protein